MGISGNAAGLTLFLKSKNIEIAGNFWRFFVDNSALRGNLPQPYFLSLNFKNIFNESPTG
jgi:hypothetical protein